MFRSLLLLALSCLVLACGTRPRPMIDAGPEEMDAGEPDAGRLRGDDPPNGWQVAVELPMTAALGTRLGVGVASAPDQFSQPLIASIHEDPNGDGNYDDNRVVFTRWDGTARAFQMQQTIEVIGGARAVHPNRDVSIARDAVNGRIAIVYAKAQDSSIRFAVSDDEGANFSLSTISSGSAVSNPSLALNGGVAHVAWIAAGEVKYATRTGLTGAWTETTVGATSGLSVSLALDASNQPGIAFFQAGTATNSSDLAFWRPGGSPTLAVSGGDVDHSLDDRKPSVTLAFVGTVPHAAFHLRRDTPAASMDSSFELFYGKASDAAGTSWTSVGIPRNGSATTFHTTSWYQALVVETGGRVNVAANFASRGAQTACGGPKLSRAADAMTFTTCAPAGFPAQFAGEWLSMWQHRPGKMTLVFHYDSRANPNLRPGIAMWREP